MRFLTLITLVFLFATSAMAQSVLSGDMIEAKQRFEQLINERLKLDLKTRMPEESFSLSTRVRLVKKPAPQKPKLPEFARSPRPTPKLGPEPFLPSMLGLLDAERILRDYEEQIEEVRRESLKRDLEAAAKMQYHPSLAGQWEFLSLYELSEVHVNLGLANFYGEEYLTQLNSWLKARIQSEFGNIGSSEVSFISDEAPSLEKPLDFLKEYELFSSIALFCGLVLLSILIWQLATFIQKAKERRFLESQQLADTERQERLKRLEAQLEKEEEVQTDEELQSMVDVAFAKVADLSESLTAQDRRQFVTLITGKGREGRLKAAYFIDSWMSKKESGSDTKLTQDERFGWLSNLDLPIKRKLDLVAEWKKLSSVELKEQNRVLEELLWDIIAYKTLGQVAVEEPFSYLEDLSVEQVQKLLIGKDAETQGLLMLYMPPQHQKAIMSRIEAPEQVKLLSHCFTNSQIEVDMLDAAHSRIKKEATEGFDKKVSVIEKVGGLLSQMDVLDEINLLRKSSIQQGSDSAKIKTHHPTLAFIDEWQDQESLKTLMSDASIDEVISLLSEFPQMEDLIIESCPPLIQAAVTDELQIAPRRQREERKEYLASLSEKLRRLVAAGRIDMAKALGEEGGPSAKLVA